MPRRVSPVSPVRLRRRRIERQRPVSFAVYAVLMLLLPGHRASWPGTHCTTDLPGTYPSSRADTSSARGHTAVTSRLYWNGT